MHKQSCRLQRRDLVSESLPPECFVWSFYCHPSEVQSRFGALSCSVLCKQAQAEIPDLAVTAGKTLLEFSILFWVLPRAACNEIFQSPGAHMFVILHGLAAVCAALAGLQFILSFY